MKGKYSYMNRYVITGASGHIGNNLVRYIYEKEPDADVILLVRSYIDILNNTRAVQKIINFNSDEELSKMITGDSVLIHLAAIIDLREKCEEETIRINYLLTKRLCDICQTNGATFIYTGSVDGILKSSDEMISEPSKYYPDKLEGGYGRSKALASQYVLDKINSDDEFMAAIILPSAVVGINDYKPSEIGRIIKRCILGKPEFGIKGGYNFVNVTDVCYVIYEAIKRKKRGQFIVSGENVSVGQLYKMINSALKIKRKPIIIPMLLVRLAMPFVDVLNPITIKSLQEPHNYSSRKAAEELDFIPSPIDKTISDTVEWFKQSIRTK